MKKAPQQSASEDRARTLLRAKALRMTTPRVAVLAALLDGPRAASHADVTAALAPVGVDRATVYRTLRALADVGLVTKADLGDRVWRFSLTTDEGSAHAEHAHFLCVACGAARCLPDGAVTLKLSVHRHSMVLDVQVRGRCGDCLGTAAP